MHIDGLLAQVVVLEDLLRLRVHEAAVRELVERRDQSLKCRITKLRGTKLEVDRFRWTIWEETFTSFSVKN